ncbi:hypothetical protein ACFQZE_23640 [Paenibacillus sp. GCM10027627]
MADPAALQERLVPVIELQLTAASAMTSAAAPPDPPPVRSSWSIDWPTRLRFSYV